MKFDIDKADFANPNHCSGIVDVLNSYATDEIGRGNPLSEDVRKRLVSELSNHPAAFVLMAFVDSQAVGIAICFMGFSTFQARPLLNIHDLAVLPEFRGLGIGRALLNTVEAYAIERGCCKLTLEVREDNRRAFGLYERFGFGDFVAGNSTVRTRFLSKSIH